MARKMKRHKVTRSKRGGGKTTFWRGREGTMGNAKGSGAEYGCTAQKLAKRGLR